MQNYKWLWMLPIFFLLSILAGAWLDKDGLWYDEVYTVKNAGGAQYGPLSPGEIYATVRADDPYQAIGYPMAIAAWGAVVGWSEFALRLSSLLFSLLTVALSYRLGKETVSAEVGLFAALIYGLSSFTIFYASELRAFSMTACFSALLIWAYLRLLKRPDKMAKLSFFLAGVALLYVHYYAAMLLIALGVYHLLFVKKDRLWLEITGLALLMGLAFLPQLPAFLEGFNRYDPANVSEAPLSAWDAVLSILHFLSNGNEPLLGLALLIGAVHAFRKLALSQERKEAKTEIYRGLVLISVFSVIILLISNEVLDILEPKRLRYAIFLWPLLAVWLAVGLAYMRQMFPQLVPVITLILPIILISLALVAYNNPRFNASYEGTETPRFRTISNIMREEGVPSDLFAFYNGKSNQAWYILFTFNYSVYDLPMPNMLTASLYNQDESISAWAWQQVEAAQRIWYGQNRTFEQNEVHTDFVAYLAENFVQCYVTVDNTELGLELYARSQAFCPSDERVMQFNGISLTGSELLEGDNLRLNLGWEIAPTVPPDSYSLAVHLTGEGSDAPILQTDVGFANASFMPMALSFDSSQLPAGEYKIWLIVYEWRTGTRLMGEAASGESGERLLLGTISRQAR
jgi:uncharacterized membrane protein